MVIPSSIKKLDWILIACVAAVVLFGVATFYHLGPRSPALMSRQLILLVLGIIVMVCISFFDYRILKNSTGASLIIYAIALCLLFLALASREIRGVSSWIVFSNFTIEPAEFAKLSLLILLAKYFSQKHVEIYRTHHILASGFYVLIPAALTMLQPDLGSTVVLVFLWLGILLFAGIKRKHLLVILMTGVVVSSLGWFLILKTYQKDRIISFINPYIDPRGTGYNILQSKVSFGSGQLTGVAFDKSAPQRAIVPEPYNDFAFAAFARKFGFTGMIALFSLLLIIMFRIGSIGMRADNNFAKLFCLGLLTIIFTHVFINGGMNMGLLPITGIPFSFLSYGGSHLMSLMIALGVVQSIKVRNRN
jgi:rod shape determining protein RodA